MLLLYFRLGVRCIMLSDLSSDTIRKIFIFCLILFFSVPFGYYYGFVYWGNPVFGAITGFVIGLATTVVILIVASKMANFFARISGERGANFSLREQLESDMQQVRYHKMRKEYGVALRKINEVLEQDHDFPEALFLKAQIVWEGFGNSALAISNLEKIKTVSGDRQSSSYRWAIALLAEIKKEENTP